MVTAARNLNSCELHRLKLLNLGRLVDVLKVLMKTSSSLLIVSPSPKFAELIDSYRMVVKQRRINKLNTAVVKKLVEHF
jgi:2-phospho-L-lactate guanylyltransferase (CobY/MobA/RfbA family)